MYEPPPALPPSTFRHTALICLAICNPLGCGLGVWAGAPSFQSPFALLVATPLIYGGDMALSLALVGRIVRVRIQPQGYLIGCLAAVGLLLLLTSLGAPVVALLTGVTLDTAGLRRIWGLVAWFAVRVTVIWLTLYAETSR
ncbi:MAG TPA: hypothetical protein VGE07_18950 [Herpetosiphonaceae bacterium]